MRISTPVPQSDEYLQRAEELFRNPRVCMPNPVPPYFRTCLHHRGGYRYIFGMEQSLSIVDLPSWSPLVWTLDHHKIIYDCMDDHLGFFNISEQMFHTEYELMKRSDLVLTSSQKLYDHACKTAGEEKVYLVRNACDYLHFSKNVKPDQEVIGLKKPVIGYIGAIAHWFDIKLIEILAKKRPEWNFLLVGSSHFCDTQAVENLSNVVFAGERPYHELPQYISSFTVCIIPFKINRLTQAANPVKIYEYLASGKPVVSTRLPEVEYLKDLVYLAAEPVEFEEAICHALQESNHEQQEKRREFAKINSWEARYKYLIKIIKSTFIAPCVSIIIVTHNNWRFTKQCLDSVGNSSYPNIEIIVVDNASTDETRDRLSELNYPDLKIVFSPVNLGFAGGNNLGVKQSSGEYLILLNNDTIVPPDWIERLIKPLREDKNLGLVGPVSNYVGNDQMLDMHVCNPSLGSDPEWLQEFYSLYKNKRRFTDMLGFFCVAMRREIFEIVGELDTNFKIGMFEDDDYCKRVKKAGYMLAIVEDAFVFHHGSATFKELPDYEMIFNKNKNYFETKWGKWVPPKPPSLYL